MWLPIAFGNASDRSTWPREWHHPARSGQLLWRRATGTAIRDDRPSPRGRPDCRTDTTSRRTDQHRHRAAIPENGKPATLHENGNWYMRTISPLKPAMLPPENGKLSETSKRWTHHHFAGSRSHHPLNPPTPVTPSHLGQRNTIDLGVSRDTAFLGSLA